MSVLDDAIDVAQTPDALSPEQLHAWLLDLCEDVVRTRVQLNLEKNAQNARRLYRKLLLRYGAAKGALDAMMRTKQITPDFYMKTVEAVTLHVAVKVEERLSV
jgi:hypothetical protein